MAFIIKTPSFRPWQSWLAFLLLLSCLCGTAANAYNAYNYDMTTPQFTPDGRLLQVEYASAAMDLSAPLVAVEIPENDLLVLLTVRNSNTQHRMVIYQDDDDEEEEEGHPLVLCLSGVLADSVALLQVLGIQAAQDFARYHQTTQTARQVATILANACQRHSFGGGLRPYGSTILVCGYDDEENNNSSSSRKRPVLLQTDPSGAILQVPADTADATHSIVRWIVGGAPTLQRQLRRRLTSALEEDSKENPTLVDTLALVARTVLKETEKKTKNEQEDGDSNMPSLEIVLLSPTLGCHRLTKSQLDGVVERI